MDTPNRITVRKGETFSYINTTFWFHSLCLVFNPVYCLQNIRSFFKGYLKLFVLSTLMIERSDSVMIFLILWKSNMKWKVIYSPKLSFCDCVCDFTMESMEIDDVFISSSPVTVSTTCMVLSKRVKCILREKVKRFLQFHGVFLQYTFIPILFTKAQFASANAKKTKPLVFGSSNKHIFTSLRNLLCFEFEVFK